jgi:hypothetical protein
MKGGLTSGVIYPGAVQTLSTRFTFSNVGGTSAGALVAALTVAAEYQRRETGSHDGFDTLGNITDELATRVGGADTKLRTLFEPDPATQKTFHAVGTLTAGGGRLRKELRALAVVRRLKKDARRDGVINTVTTPQVAAILVNGKGRVQTVASPGLPYGLRAARVVIRTSSRHVTAGSRPGPALVPLDAHGHAIPQRPPPRSFRFPSRSWQYPAAPAQGACELRATGVPGLSPQWGDIASAIVPYPGRIIGRAFFSCIDTEYDLQGLSLDAAILLDAAHPGQVAPAEIPGLAPLSQAPGLYNAIGYYGAQGPMTAKREGNAWIVVAGRGKNAEQARIRVLRHLTAPIPWDP